MPASARRPYSWRSAVIGFTRLPRKGAVAADAEAFYRAGANFPRTAEGVMLNVRRKASLK
jgi:hypothetical protein